MRTLQHTRRSFLQTSAGALSTGMMAPYVFTADAEDADKPKSKGKENVGANVDKSA